MLENGDFSCLIWNIQKVTREVLSHGMMNCSQGEATGQILKEFLRNVSITGVGSDFQLTTKGHP